MSQAARRPATREQMLDYLFQESIEEQFEELRLSQDKQPKRFAFVSLFSNLFRSEKPVEHEN